jgi:hypothetical protein
LCKNWLFFTAGIDAALKEKGEILPDLLTGVVVTSDPRHAKVEH